MDVIGSSSTSSRTSASSSTSDPVAGPWARLTGWVRLTHPFPSVLDGLVCAAVALLAGAAPTVALGVGVSMTLLQLGIGTVNDVVDAALDAGRKPGKPIPAGTVSRSAARAAAVLLFASGTALALAVSPTLALLAIIVIGIGLAYDLRLKGTAWSWLPFAVGIPVLPVFGWIGAAATIPVVFAVLIPAAIGAGAGLAVGNALVDVERDRAAGISSVALALGPDRAARVSAGLFAGIWLAAVGSAAVSAAPPLWIVLVSTAGIVPLMAAIVAARASGGAGEPAAIRERAWQVEAIGLAVLATVWLAAVLGPVRGAG